MGIFNRSNYVFTMLEYLLSSVLGRKKQRSKCIGHPVTTSKEINELQNGCIFDLEELTAVLLARIFGGPLQILQIKSFFFFVSFVFLGPCHQHMDVPRPGVQLEL